MSVAKAAKRAGYSHRCAYLYRDRDPAFAEAWNDAYEAGTDLMEDELHRRAVTGVREPILYQGVVVKYVRRYSDSLLLAGLKCRRPDKWRENYHITHDHQIGLHVRVEQDVALVGRKLQEALERSEGVTVDQPALPAPGESDTLF